VSELISPTFNLTVLILVLVYYLRQPLREFVSQRHHTVRQELERVSVLLRQANEQNVEFTAKLSAIDVELSSLREQVMQDAEVARQRIAVETQKLSATIIADARAAAEALYVDLKTQLYSELGMHILERAERILKERLTGDDRTRIRQEFTKQVEAAR
jgi:F0F1-type ATP synthase membrane subunit b/b'